MGFFLTNPKPRRLSAPRAAQSVPISKSTVRFFLAMGDSRSARARNYGPVDQNWLAQKTKFCFVPLIVGSYAEYRERDQLRKPTASRWAPLSQAGTSGVSQRARRVFSSFSHKLGFRKPYPARRPKNVRRKLFAFPSPTGNSFDTTLVIDNSNAHNRRRLWRLRWPRRRHLTHGPLFVKFFIVVDESAKVGLTFRVSALTRCGC